ncbi:glycosyltransferase family 1 protein, partial [Sulfurovum sp.]
ECEKKLLFSQIREKGVKILFVVYDILPILHPQWWPKGGGKIHTEWLKTILKVSDKLLCISQAVINDIQTWVKDERLKVSNTLEYEWFHLGADIDNSKPSNGLPKNAKEVIKSIESHTSFIMVGTLEPRKGHAQTIAAFEELWEQGIGCNLAIVGKQGWLVEELVAKLNNHPELNKRLFWFNGISDEYLEKIYESSTCLIAASEGEGFGLPLIEAAQHKKSIIARDIPVFREVAGEYAYYFDNSKEPEVIALAVKEWLELYKNDKHPKSDGMPWLTWEESTKQLLHCLNI